MSLNLDSHSQDNIVSYPNNFTNNDINIRASFFKDLYKSRIDYNLPNKERLLTKGEQEIKFYRDELAMYMRSKKREISKLINSGKGYKIDWRDLLKQFEIKKSQEKTDILGKITYLNFPLNNPSDIQIVEYYEHIFDFDFVLPYEIGYSDALKMYIKSKIDISFLFNNFIFRESDLDIYLKYIKIDINELICLINAIKGKISFGTFFKIFCFIDVNFIFEEKELLTDLLKKKYISFISEKQKNEDYFRLKKLIRE